MQPGNVLFRRMNAQVLSLTKSGNFIGLLFFLVAFAFACGGSPSASEDKKDVTQAPSSSRLSFGEYLAVCAGPTSGAIDEEITLKEFAEALGEFTERLESVEPPEEVTDWAEYLSNSPSPPCKLQ